MSDIQPMPRAAVIAAGWIIVLAAVVGLGAGIVPAIKRLGGGDLDAGEVVAPIRTAANATPLTAPAVTEADVRRWAREELAAQHAAAPKKPKLDTDTDAAADAAGDTATPAPPTVVTPSNGNVVAPKPQPQQIPF